MGASLEVIKNKIKGEVESKTNIVFTINCGRLFIFAEKNILLMVLQTIWSLPEIKGFECWFSDRNCLVIEVERNK